MKFLWLIVVLCGWVVLCIATAVQNSRLWRMFRARYPQIAEREIPFPFEQWRSAEKMIFFFRKRAVDVLRIDARLWRERQIFVSLVVVTVCFWFACGLLVLIAPMLLR